MRPTEPYYVTTAAGARHVLLAATQPEYEQLPAIIEANGDMHTRWLPTDTERQAIADGHAILLTVKTFNTPPQPVRLTVEGAGA